MKKSFLSDFIYEGPDIIYWWGGVKTKKSVTFHTIES